MPKARFLAGSLLLISGAIPRVEAAPPQGQLSLPKAFLVCSVLLGPKSDTSRKEAEENWLTRFIHARGAEVRLSQALDNPFLTSWDEIEDLLKCGASINTSGRHSGFTPLGLSVHFGQPVTALIKQKADVHSKDATGMTPLMHAAEVEDMEAVRALLRAGADVAAVDDEHRTALFYARHSPGIREELERWEPRRSP
jgi:hypothetical protein